MKSNYTHSTHCVYNIGYHLIWCTKYRKKLIYGNVEHTLKRLVREKCSSLGIAVGEMEVMPDHIHVFVHSKQVLDPSYIVQQLKGFTSHRLRRLCPPLQGKRGASALWSKSDFCESVGHISQDTVQRIIANQKLKG